MMNLYTVMRYVDKLSIEFTVPMGTSNVMGLSGFTDVVVVEVVVVVVVPVVCANAGTVNTHNNSIAQTATAYRKTKKLLCAV